MTDELPTGMTLALTLTTFVTAEMFQTIHWLESYIDEQAKAGMKEGG